MYTHGLEKIYAFETVNPNSVKTVGARSPAEDRTPRAKHTACTEQLIFNFGPYYQESLPTFRVKEPLSSLGLTPFALKHLMARQITTIEQAAILFASDPNSYKSLGQSHIEEIKEKINAFVGKAPFAYQKTVDWESLVRIITAGLDTKERTCLLARYQLSQLFETSAADHQEIMRLSREQIAKTIDQALSKIGTDFVQQSLAVICEAFVRPWLRRRHGFATESEIYQRLWQIAAPQRFFWQILSFIKEFAEFANLHKIAPVLYAADARAATDYRAVARCATTYFYQPFARYPLDKLVSLVSREFAATNHGFADGFIEKVLMTCPDFCLQQDAQSLCKSM